MPVEGPGLTSGLFSHALRHEAVFCGALKGFAVRSDRLGCAGVSLAFLDEAVFRGACERLADFRYRPVVRPTPFPPRPSLQARRCPHSLRLLRAHRERARWRAAEQGDEL